GAVVHAERVVGVAVHRFGEISHIGRGSVLPAPLDRVPGVVDRVSEGDARLARGAAAQGRRRGAERARAVGLADAGRARAGSGAVALLAQLDDAVPAYGRRAGAAPLAAARAEGRVDPVAVLAHLAHAVAAHGGRGVGARRAREAEAGDACAPIAARGQVLVRVPEGAVVHRIEVQRAVVAPALVALHPAARHD